MDAPQRSMNWPERLVARFFVTRIGAWLGLYVLPCIDRPLLYLSRGRFSMSPGQPILLLMTTGAKSGRRRSTPLLYFRQGDQIVVLASNGGQPRHPAWFYNLRAHQRRPSLWEAEQAPTWPMKRATKSGRCYGTVQPPTTSASMCTSSASHARSR